VGEKRRKRKEKVTEIGFGLVGLKDIRGQKFQSCLKVGKVEPQGEAILKKKEGI